VRLVERIRADGGQSTVEWVALVLLVSLALSFLGALAGLGLPGAALARAITDKLVCATGLGDGCPGGGDPSALARTYGEDVAALVSEHAPMILYEPGMRALPVDYRRCREDACADGPESGRVWRSESGESTVAFVHVIDCRGSSPTAAAQAAADCSGDRSGNLYLQYWVYYPGSATGEGSVAPGLIRQVSGGRTYHPDDWESFTVRLGPAGGFQRASSHHGYGKGWVPEHGYYHVAGGSHAGSVDSFSSDRATPAARLKLIPLEPIASRDPEFEFAVTPPWLKKVWFDPEYERTD
jgi:hypothetical protein